MFSPARFPKLPFLRADRKLERRRPRRPSASRKGDRPDLSGCRILVIERSLLTQDALRPLLERRGYRVFQARSSEEGQELAAECRPDLILLETDLVDRGEGFELCRKLKSSENLAEVPIVLLSEYGETEGVITGLRAGASDYLIKPCQSRELLERIALHLGTQLLARAQREEIEALQEVNLAQQDLLRVVSHDLRNPIGVIRCMAAILENDDAQPHPDNHVRIIDNLRVATDEMLALVQELIGSSEPGQPAPEGIDSKRQSLVTAAWKAIRIHSKGSHRGASSSLRDHLEEAGRLASVYRPYRRRRDC